MSSESIVNQDRELVSLVASGLVRISHRLTNQAPLDWPYPDPLVKGMSQAALRFLQGGGRPVESLPDLLRRCHQPLEEWGLDLERAEASGALLEEYLPTETCMEWARSTSDVTADLRETEYVEKMRAAPSPELYAALRRLLIKHPVMTLLEIQSACNDPVLSPLSGLLGDAYEIAPLGAMVDGAYQCCANCGNLLIRTARGDLHCENARCRWKGNWRGGRRLSRTEDVRWLHRGLRRFIAAPGLTEIHLAEKLSDRGLQVELWPQYDAYDLRVAFADGQVWAVDVKDWANPVLLARSVKPIPDQPRWDAAFFVFPDERRERQANYREVFDAYRPNESRAQAKALFVSEFVRQAVRKLKVRKANA